MNARGSSSHRSDVVLIEADRVAALGGHKKLIAAVGQPGPDKRIVVAQAKGNESLLADIAEFAERRALDESVLCHHDKVHLMLVLLLDADHLGDFLIAFQRQKVDNIGAFGIA